MCVSQKGWTVKLMPRYLQDVTASRAEPAMWYVQTLHLNVCPEIRINLTGISHELHQLETLFGSH